MNLGRYLRDVHVELFYYGVMLWIILHTVTTRTSAPGSFDVDISSGKRRCVNVNGAK